MSSKGIETVEAYPPETESALDVSGCIGEDDDASNDFAVTSFGLENLSLQLGIGTRLNGNTGMGSLGMRSFPLFSILMEEVPVGKQKHGGSEHAH